MSVINDFNLEKEVLEAKIIQLQDSHDTYAEYTKTSLAEYNTLSDQTTLYAKQLWAGHIKAKGLTVERAGQIVVAKNELKIVNDRISAYLKAINEGMELGATEDDSTAQVEKRFADEAEAEIQAKIDAEKKKRNTNMILIGVGVVALIAIVYFVKKARKKKSKK